MAKILVAGTGAGSDDFALLRLLLGIIRNDDAALRFLFAFDPTNDDAGPDHGWAASNSSLRIIASPHFDIPPVRSTSPDWWRRGVKPNTAPTALEFLKRAGTSTVARKVSATIGPTPGTLIKRRQTSSWRTIASSRRCSTPSM